MPFAVRYKAAYNPNAPPAILTQLAGDGDWRIRSLVARHPNTSPEILVQLSKDLDSTVRSEVAFNPHTPTRALVRLACEDQSQQVRRNAIANPNIPPEVLVQLAGDSNLQIREYVARNPRTPPQVLLQLVRSCTDPQELVSMRHYVAKNPNTPVEVLIWLANDPVEFVRHEAARNPNAPVEATMQHTHIGILVFSPELMTKVVWTIIPGCGELVVFTDDDLRVRPVHPKLLEKVLSPFVGDKVVKHDQDIMAITPYVLNCQYIFTKEPISKDRLKQLVFAVRYGVPEIMKPLAEE